MASLIPPYYSHDYIFTNEFCELLTPMTCSDGSSRSSSEMQTDQENIVPLFDNGLLNMVPSDHSDITSSMSVALFPERLGVPDMAIAAMPDYQRSLVAIAGTEAIGSGYQHEACDLLAECNGMVSNFWPVSPLTAENWDWKIPSSGNSIWADAKVEEPPLKVARYSAEERKDRILRYLKKRSQRNFNKTIKYACRKTLADKRVRVRGRFAKNNELLCDDETIMKTDQNFQDSKELCFNNPVHMKSHDDEWLQEAISNLMYYHMLPDNAMELP